jgi:CO/xanthine dehydrogenase FAD-binding subunit
VLLALNGHVVVQSTRGQRIIPAAELFTSVMQTALAQDELMVEAWFPGAHGKHGIAEESRRHGDFALAGGVRYGDRLALFGVAPTPVMADPKDPTKGLQPSGDLEATPEFRLHLVQAITDRLFAA